jgi:hypothetical protein
MPVLPDPWSDGWLRVTTAATLMIGTIVPAGLTPCQCACCYNSDVRCGGAGFVFRNPDVRDPVFRRIVVRRIGLHCNLPCRRTLEREIVPGQVVVLLSTDLMTGSRLSPAIRARGWELDSRMSVEQAVSAVRETRASLLFVDLTVSPDVAEKTINALKDGPRPRVVAFGPHVAADALAAAEAAGCDVVWPRSRFFNQFENLLTSPELASNPAAES